MPIKIAVPVSNNQTFQIDDIIKNQNFLQISDLDPNNLLLHINALLKDLSVGEITYNSLMRKITLAYYDVDHISIFNQKKYQALVLDNLDNTQIINTFANNPDLKFTYGNLIILNRIAFVILDNLRTGTLDFRSIVRALKQQISNITMLHPEYLKACLDYNYKETIEWLKTLISNKYNIDAPNVLSLEKFNFANLFYKNPNSKSVQNGNLTELGIAFKRQIIQSVNKCIDYQSNKSNKSIAQIYYTIDYLIDSRHLEMLFYFWTSTFSTSLYNFDIDTINEKTLSSMKLKFQNEARQFYKDVANAYLKAKYKKDDTINFLSTVSMKIINVIIKNYVPDLVKRVIFPKYENGYYKYTWLDTDKNHRNEAIPILKYLNNDKQLAEDIISQALNISLKEFEKTYMTWKKYIKTLITHYAATEKLHLAVRKELIKLNYSVAIDKSNELNNLNDKIVSIDDEGNIIGKNKNKSSILIDFNPRNDAERERPCVIIREFINEEKNFKDHVIIGKQGANHGSILNSKKYLPLLEKSIKNNSPTFACCYIIGKIAIIDNDRFMFPSVNEIVNALKNSNKFTKIYIIDNSNAKKLHRLAKKI